MKKLLPLYLYGIITIFAGIFLMFSQYLLISFPIIKFTLGLSLIIGSIYAFLAAFSRQRKQVQFAYHEMHAVAMLAYGISVLVFGNNLETLIYLTAFLFIFYSFSEVIFCTWLFNLARKINIKILLIRLVLGLAIGVGAIAAISCLECSLESFAALFILVGINVLLYAPVLKSKELTNEENEV